MKDIKPVAWVVNCDLGSGVKGVFESRERAMDLCHSVSRTHVIPLYAIPEWCVVVPVEPTEDMRSAYLDASIAPISTLSIAGYKAMIKAAQDEG